MVRKQGEETLRLLIECHKRHPPRGTLSIASLTSTRCEPFLALYRGQLTKPAAPPGLFAPAEEGRYRRTHDRSETGAPAGHCKQITPKRSRRTHLCSGRLSQRNWSSIVPSEKKKAMRHVAVSHDARFEPRA